MLRRYNGTRCNGQSHRISVSRIQYHDFMLSRSLPFFSVESIGNLCSVRRAPFSNVEGDNHMGCKGEKWAFGRQTEPLGQWEWFLCWRDAKVCLIVHRCVVPCGCVFCGSYDSRYFFRSIAEGFFMCTVRYELKFFCSCCFKFFWKLDIRTCWRVSIWWSEIFTEVCNSLDRVGILFPANSWHFQARKSSTFHRGSFL